MNVWLENFEFTTGVLEIFIRYSSYRNFLRKLADDNLRIKQLNTEDEISQVSEYK
jgi:hypothetical protein